MNESVEHDDRTTPATVIVSRRVVPGREEDGERWIHELRRAAERAPGYLSSSFHPPQGAHPGEWTIVYTFASAQMLEAWLDSPTRRSLMEQEQAFIVDGTREQRVVSTRTDSITLVSSARVRPEHVDAHRNLHDRGVLLARRLGGLVHAELLPPVEGVQPDTVALLTFATRADLDRWLESDERRHMLESMVPLIEGERVVNLVGGYAGWFPQVGGSPPKQWKQALIVLAGILPVSLVVTLLRHALAPDMALPLTVFIGAVANVALLTWVVMPVLTGWFRGWLAR